MKNATHTLARRATKGAAFAWTRALGCLGMLSLGLATRPARAELPKFTPPTDGIGGTTVSDGDWLGMMGAYFKLGITIGVLALCGWFLLQVIVGAIAKWKEYTSGRAHIGDLKEYLIMGAVLTVAIVGLGTYALKTVQ